jgi:2'-5' RNA ligase
VKNRYNIALIPISKADEFINFTQNLATIADRYKVSPTSLPHVTLCQFMAEDSEVEALWERVCESSVQQSIVLTLNDFSCITIDNSSWVSLLPDNLEILMKMHCTVANLIEGRIGRCFDKFDAHMTLISTNQEDYKDKVLSLPYVPIQDDFILSLGKSDDIGQFKELIYSCNMLENKILKMKC